MSHASIKPHTASEQEPEAAAELAQRSRPPWPERDEVSEDALADEHLVSDGPVPGDTDDRAASSTPTPTSTSTSTPPPLTDITTAPATPTTPTTRVTAGTARRKKVGLLDRVEAFISRLSTKNNFWHRVCSLIWLPFAFRSGIRMKRIDSTTFHAILPFRRFNRNWYNAMAGAALLGNAEIAGGMYVFGACGGDYTVVCKHLEYKFLRPCFGPAIYRISPQGGDAALAAHLSHGGEFNIIIDMDVVQQLSKPGEKEKRVGRCAATFHVTPKQHHKNKKEREVESAKA